MCFGGTKIWATAQKRAFAPFQFIAQPKDFSLKRCPGTMHLRGLSLPVTKLHSRWCIKYHVHAWFLEKCSDIFLRTSSRLKTRAYFIQLDFETSLWWFNSSRNFVLFDRFILCGIILTDLRDLQIFLPLTKDCLYFDVFLFDRRSTWFWKCGI